MVGENFEGLNHRAVRTLLEHHGWTKCGEGDWAIALRSPDGMKAARISPYEPSYKWFIELCRRMPDNPYLPRIFRTSQLQGGGHAAILEYLEPATDAEQAAFYKAWQHDTELRPALEALDRECRATVSFWMGIDLGDHVMRSLDGQIKLIDLVGVSGNAMIDQIYADIDEFFRIIPRDSCRYFLELAHFSRSYAAEDRRRVAAIFAEYDAR